MGNCLKTQLKENVQNTSLKKWECLRLNTYKIDDEFYDAKAQKLTIRCNGSFTVKALGSSYFAESEAGLVSAQKTEETYTNYAILYFPNVDGAFDISNLYNLTGIAAPRNSNEHSIYGVDISDLEYSPITSLIVQANQNIAGSIDSLKNTPLSTLLLVNTGVSGDIANLPSTITEFRLNGSMITGNITSIADKVALTVAHCSNYINGTAKDFVESSWEYRNQRIAAETTSVQLFYISLDGSGSLSAFKINFYSDKIEIVSLSNVVLATYNSSGWN